MSLDIRPGRHRSTSPRSPMAEGITSRHSPRCVFAQCAYSIIALLKLSNRVVRCSMADHRYYASHDSSGELSSTLLSTRRLVILVMSIRLMDNLPVEQTVRLVRFESTIWQIFFVRTPQGPPVTVGRVLASLIPRTPLGSCGPMISQAITRGRPNRDGCLRERTSAGNGGKHERKQIHY
jgi:hypothetical protein